MPKCEVIAIANQKGGVGKTTTTFTLGVALARQGKKVLLIDGDPQGDLTTSMGWHNPDDIPETISTLMEQSINDKDINFSNLILHHDENVDLIPSNLELSSLEVILYTAMSREQALRKAIHNIKDKYDYILIDCMPSLGMLTINALASADKVIIPVESQFLAAKGMNRLLETVLKVRRNINPNIKVGGIILTMVDGRTNLSKNMSDELRKTYGNVFRMFNSVIPKSTKIAEASREGKSIFLYDKRNRGAIAYENLAKEVLEDGKERTKSINSNIQAR